MLTIIASLLAVSADTAPAAAPGQPLAIAASKQRPVLGGAGSVSVSDEGVQGAAEAAAASVDATVDTVTHATRQVVAGTIYRISFTTTDGRSYQAEVLRALNGEYSVRDIEEVGDTGSNSAEDD